MPSTATSSALTISGAGARGSIATRLQFKTVRQTPSSLPRRKWRHMVRSPIRSEEHTSELQSHLNLVCRLLLEKKKKKRCHTKITQCLQEAISCKGRVWF